MAAAVQGTASPETSCQRPGRITGRKNSEEEDMARKFMFVCFGVLALAMAFHLGAKSGQATEPLQTADIAIKAGLIQHGYEIPLPFYEDGSQAVEDDCVWVLSPMSAGEDWTNFYSFECNDGNPPDRNVYYRFSMSGGEGQPPEQHYDGVARYLIIAVRNSGTWCAGVRGRGGALPWGRIKADFSD
jgi:hypothetical protein